MSTDISEGTPSDEDIFADETPIIKPSTPEQDLDDFFDDDDDDDDKPAIEKPADTDPTTPTSSEDDDGKPKVLPQNQTEPQTADPTEPVVVPDNSTGGEITEPDVDPAENKTSTTSDLP